MIFFEMMCPAAKQTLAPAIKGVQVVSQSPLPAAQKSKEAAGGTFRFVTSFRDISEFLHLQLPLWNILRIIIMSAVFVSAPLCLMTNGFGLTSSNACSYHPDSQLISQDN